MKSGGRKRNCSRGRRKQSKPMIIIYKESFPVEKWTIGHDSKGSENQNKFGNAVPLEHLYVYPNGSLVSCLRYLITLRKRSPIGFKLRLN